MRPSGSCPGRWAWEQHDSQAEEGTELSPEAQSGATYYFSTPYVHSLLKELFDPPLEKSLLPMQPGGSSGADSERFPSVTM